MTPIRPNAIAVYVFRFVPGGWEFLQIRRAGPLHHGTWQTVYGSIEPNETAVAAAQRELREETNLTPKRMFQVEYVETFYLQSADTLALMPVFGIEVARDAPITLNAEHDAFRWIPETLVETSFMWRTQREAIRIMMEGLRANSPAFALLQVSELTERAP